MPAPAKRNPLFPWFIGLAIIVVIDIFVAYQFFAPQYRASIAAEVIVLVVVPAVYLALMYLTFKSQA